MSWLLETTFDDKQMIFLTIWFLEATVDEMADDNLWKPIWMKTQTIFLIILSLEANSDEQIIYILDNLLFRNQY